MFDAIYIPDGTLYRRLARFKSRKSACAYHPSRAIAGERVPGYHFIPRTSADGTRYVDSGRVSEVPDLDHTGWYADDPELGDTPLMVPILLALPHGRFLAGYRFCDYKGRPYSDADNGGTFDVTAVYLDKREAGHMANEEARIAAEHERDYQEEQREEFRRETEESERLDNLAACHPSPFDAVPACGQP